MRRNSGRKKRKEFRTEKRNSGRKKNSEREKERKPAKKRSRENQNKKESANKMDVEILLWLPFFMTAAALALLSSVMTLLTGHRKR
ncbi:MAG: hypothetical protein PHR92_17150 [Lachnospiraceae bacterium]|nr:hypothetical protein [Lachnospiraceae bacterium]